MVTRRSGEWGVGRGERAENRMLSTRHPPLATRPSELMVAGGAQIDRFGNINTTVLGPYERPRVRLPGAGGAPEIAIHAKRTLVIARLERRAFPENVDFITSPGHRAHGRT